jgi:hypothetical protein
MIGVPKSSKKTTSKQTAQRQTFSDLDCCRGGLVIIAQLVIQELKHSRSSELLETQYFDRPLQYFTLTVRNNIN